MLHPYSHGDLPWICAVLPISILTCGSEPGCRIHLWSDKCQGEVTILFVLAEFDRITFSSLLLPLLVPLDGSSALIQTLILTASSFSSSALVYHHLPASQCLSFALPIARKLNRKHPRLEPMLRDSKPNCWCFVSMTSESALFCQGLGLFTVVKGQMQNFYTSLAIAIHHAKDHESDKITKKALPSQNPLQLFSTWTISLCMWGCMHKNSRETFPSHLTWSKNIFFPFLLHSYRAMKCKDFWPHFDTNNPFNTLNFLNNFFNAPLSHAIDFTATIAVLLSDKSCFTRLKGWKSISEFLTGS